MRAQLSDYAFGDSRPREEAHFHDVMTKRFLAIRVFAMLDSAPGNGEMHMVGHGHIDRIEALAFLTKQLAKIGIEASLRSELGGGFEMLGINIAERNNLNTFVVEEIVEIIPAHAADTDASVV